MTAGSLFLSPAANLLAAEISELPEQVPALLQVTELADLSRVVESPQLMRTELFTMTALVQSSIVVYCSRESHPQHFCDQRSPNTYVF